MPDLLTKLKKTVDDPKLFDLTFIDDKTAAKTQFREIFASLHVAAYVAWRNPIENEDDPDYGLETPHPGGEIFEIYPLLPTDWLEDIRGAIHAVRASADEEERLFLSFMDGYLMCGWDERIRKKRAGLEEKSRD